MHVLISYDISDHKVRKKFFSYLREKGLHSQKSVFECDLEPEDIKQVHSFAQELDLEPQDSIVLYPLCKRCSSKASILGQGIRLEETNWIVI
ncbi:MAG: CRISPR-associated endonuclease Cas2 [Desulfovibrionaceae bacterium]|nr:CRISPR-associated endonuclease Cas2 [Desulfovibrionaceae bacterium]